MRVEAMLKVKQRQTWDASQSFQSLSRMRNSSKENTVLQRNSPGYYKDKRDACDH